MGRKRNYYSWKNRFFILEGFMLCLMKKHLPIFFYVLWQCSRWKNDKKGQIKNLADAFWHLPNFFLCPVEMLKVSLISSQLLFCQKLRNKNIFHLEKDVWSAILFFHKNWLTAEIYAWSAIEFEKNQKIIFEKCYK